MRKVFRYAHILFLLSIFFFGSFSSIAQVTHRNLLPEFTNPELTQAIISQEEFKPFPQTPEGWKKILEIL